MSAEGLRPYILDASSRYPLSCTSGSHLDKKRLVGMIVASALALFFILTGAHGLFQDVDPLIVSSVRRTVLSIRYNTGKFTTRNYICL